MTTDSTGGGEFHLAGGKNASDFIHFMAQKIPLVLYKEAETATKGQSHSPVWHELRFARITASKLYEAAHCNTYDGTLVETIIGAYKLKDTVAMKRGRALEKHVLNVVQKKVGLKFKNSGLFLLPNCPILGASPDGISDNFVVEIKCPSKTTGTAVTR
ncbi:hypothetical protein NQ317_000843 [Molorchus minor]|uniref:YqaJ viral recombinase domain-containing protein n=1 Tax=Molorchus minor TaxID=1323400 RepID=A0ABQ9J9B7_9CUCU|nr:hypothetical protein NQ317_000843 [Molorchus minor]